MLEPTDLNSALRLVLIAERRGPEFLYDADRMCEMLGRDRLAEFDGPVFEEARRMVERAGDRLSQDRVNARQLAG